MFYTTTKTLPVPIPFEDLSLDDQKKHLEARRIFMEFLMKMHKDATFIKLIKEASNEKRR